MASTQFSGIRPLDAIFTVSSATLFASSLALQKTILKKPRFFTSNHIMDRLFRPTLFAWKILSTTSILTASVSVSSFCILMAATGYHTPRELGGFLRDQLSFARAKSIPNDIDAPSWDEVHVKLETENNM
ncbi:hypothetical protein SPOG_03112 [Schizosaccharomyces cryophilus OY26]|uniref:Uncharacterized protein n=1 Tax=Schizosaccharomyces cryophilus (strain OY26 / ATCC MYA-4695 / CBS 11777 / NBRC 106824 / NRRL Y48691) TaxID=653667 RepID=S9W535_SCHCR|nr:uncharacterized protein SPOG_03112 [Schizosaccharomyces cryophilus OY26]EPY53654.1 hypothetical protein SPOG_03112 [Schizosaccharomyces cryophilus OY26]